MTIEKRKSGYIIKSRKGKQISRPYKSKRAARKRLKQIEYFSRKKR